MSKLSFLDKINIFFNTIINNKISILILLLLIFLGYIFITNNKDNEKVTKKIYIGVYSSLVFLIVVFYYEYLGKLFDYMMNSFFVVIYFPNLAIYFLAVLISNIIVLISIFNYKIPKIIKNINIIIYLLITYLLTLLVGVIADKNLNIYKQESIYNNQNAHALIELSSIIFVSWIIFLLFYKWIRKYQNKNYNTKVVKKKILPSNVIVVRSPDKAFKYKKEELKPQIIKGDIEKEIEKRARKLINESKEFENLLSKEDYIILLNMLKEKKQKDAQIINSNTDEQASYAKLQELYKSVK